MADRSRSVEWNDDTDMRLDDETLIERLKEESTDHDPTCNELLEMAAKRIAELKGIQSAEPEIIACVDCKYWIRHDRRCGHWNHGVKPLDWCSYSERRKNE